MKILVYTITAAISLLLVTWLTFNSDVVSDRHNDHGLTEKNIVPIDANSKFVALKDAPVVKEFERDLEPTPFELQAASDDYNSLAIELLNLARNGDVNSQFSLAALILYCQTYADAPYLIDEINKLKASNASDLELSMLSNLDTEIRKCAIFFGSDFKEFNDGSRGHGAMGAVMHWLTEAHNNNLVEASVALFVYGLAGLSEPLEEGEDLNKMLSAVKTAFKTTNYEAVSMFLNASSLQNAEAVFDVLKKQGDFFAATGHLNFDIKIVPKNGMSICKYSFC
jgi:hypothetical protein